MKAKVKKNEADLPLMTAGFIVTGMEFDPNECSRHFEVEATQVRTKGEIQPRSKCPAPHSSWSVTTKWARFDSTDAVLRLILDVIWPKRAQIRGFAVKNKLKITIVVNIRGGLGKRNFLYEFSPRMVTQIAYFRAELGLDVY